MNLLQDLVTNSHRITSGMEKDLCACKAQSGYVRLTAIGECLEVSILSKDTDLPMSALTHY